jgi:ribose/xylose/arabinose/galactoside ABC-type transport system permease subunit
MSNVLPVDISFKRGISAPFWHLFDKIGPLLLLAVVLLAVTAVRPTFLTSANLLTIGLQASVNALLAIGQTLVVVAGGIDLSVGTTMSLSMATIRFSLNLFGMEPFPQQIVVGVVLIGAVYLDTIRVAQEERRTKARAHHH